jgi:transcriptional regulator GlxA family with amidase domain
MPPSDGTMAEIAAWIETHADEPLPIAELAARTATSPSSLQRRFRAAIGSTPKEYQRALRIGRIKGGVIQDFHDFEAIWTRTTSDEKPGNGPLKSPLLACSGL